MQIWRTTRSWCSWVLNEIWMLDLSSALIGMLLSSSKLFFFFEQSTFKLRYETVIGTVLCYSQQAWFFLLLLLQHLQNYLYTYLHLQLLTYNYVLFLQVSFFFWRQKKLEQLRNYCFFLLVIQVIHISIVKLRFLQSITFLQRCGLSNVTIQCFIILKNKNNNRHLSLTRGKKRLL